ncbi:MAG TPA: DUF1569 domain-containing protein [Thermoanaerobaculia bacterium]|nr:DUF1569 domain-containing protein [Thermoanaerobaculia bacterium]
MKTLFEPADRDSILKRLEALHPDSTRQWGTMNAAQMLCHCAIALETGTGDRPMKQKFIGKILMPFFRTSILGEKPFKRNSPTDPSFVVSNECDFAAEQKRLTELIERFVQRGPSAAATETHAFFGKLSGEEWGELMYKHIDHHLQQFGV